MEAALERVRHLDEPIVLVTDTLPLQREKKALAKAFRTAIRGSLGDREFVIAHHASAARAGLQAVDYCTWAMQRRLRGDRRSYDLIRPWIRSEWWATGVGTQKSDLPSYPF